MKHCSWTQFHLISTHRFIPRAETINAQASCAYCSWLWECAEENGALNSYWKPYVCCSSHKKLGESNHQNGAQFNPNSYFHSLHLSAFSLNYQWQNAFNPLQCSVRILFNVFHLPTNHKAIKTEHTSWWKQTQYVEPKEKIPSVQQMLELTFSLLRSSLLPLWVSAFTSKLFSMKLHQSVVFFFCLTVCVWFLYSTFVCGSLLCFPWH